MANNKPKINLSDIQVTRHLSDGFTLSAMVDGYRFKRRYIGWTLKEAKKNFIEEAKNA